MPVRRRRAASVRVRRDGATFTVPCLEGERHIFVMNPDGTFINSFHDAEADQVAWALGASRHPCGRAALSYSTAEIIFDALTGKRDVPGLKHTARNGWRDRCECQTCQPNLTYVPSQEHVTSMAHQAARTGTDPALVREMFRWIEQNARSRRRLPPPRTREDYRVAFARIGVDSRSEQDRWFPIFQQSLITPQFVKAAVPFVGATPGDVHALRIGGVRVEWIRSLAAHTTRSAVAYAHEHNGMLASTLAASRNVDPVLVARFLNAGVTAHFHTYSRAHARPEQVLAVYRATRGEKSLADMLGEGLTVHAAMREVGVV